MALLADGSYLAGFATKDFALLSECTCGSIECAVAGVRHQLPDGRTVTLLGDGRSLNLFENEGIPNRGYDAYRVGALLAAVALCCQAHDLPVGLDTALADRVIAESGLFEAYYDLYLGGS
ncbi:S-adenosylhomocysteine hydrolase [Kitasatospora sp. GAS204A]|uniref:hypothetical protein n=1 Tax=unclassified Kitasatospora TaxID=2633591 RepID=UPI0024731A4E|nr:hypothetical protein [Kitasatospora sp. GAS204B]MDH6119854.1 S-adenosylhomocysteine hydrolase [Kitasatospora sp. GAS204B]